MARIVGGIGTSHIPAIGNAIARDLTGSDYWRPFFEGYPPVRDWLDATKPDIAVVVYNDHGLNFFLDQMPTFAVGAASEYENRDEGWGLPTLAPFPGDRDFSWHLIGRLVADHFDITTCQAMAVDHGFVVPMQLLWPSPMTCPVRTVPIHVNTVQHPLPTPQRCWDFGLALGNAIRSYPSPARVVVLGTGGLSHQLDGQRAGFINPEFDRRCLDEIVARPEALTALSIRDLVRLAGTQGTELIQWLVMRAALGPEVRVFQKRYHAPVSNTGSGLLLLEAAA